MGLFNLWRLIIDVYAILMVMFDDLQQQRVAQAAAGLSDGANLGVLLGFQQSWRGPAARPHPAIP